MSFTQRDLEYLRANYVTLEQAVNTAIESGVLPRPSYVLPDGTEMVPADYFALVDLRSAFEERHQAAGGRPEDLEEDWDGYMSGTYGVCLRDVTPETIVHKTALVRSLTGLLAAPRPDDADWRDAVHRQVGELDELEREFAPDYDRDLVRFGRPPSRDVLIEGARKRFPELFTAP